MALLPAAFSVLGLALVRPVQERLALRAQVLLARPAALDFSAALLVLERLQAPRAQRTVF